jgi:hypothetical protein
MSAEIGIMRSAFGIVIPSGSPAFSKESIRFSQSAIGLMIHDATYHLYSFINRIVEFVYSVDVIANRLKFGAFFLSDRSLWTGIEKIFGKENPFVFSNSIIPNAMSLGWIP